MTKNIIGFSGRMRSGKGVLADICEKQGYKKLYFALPLKEMCAKFLNVTIDELNRLKNEKIPINISLDDKSVDFFSNETDIPKEIVTKIFNQKTIHDVRELIQFIGTDLIRSFNMNWHVNKIRQMIKPNEKYVIEDVRFPNEKQMIEDIGGDTWFVIRPKLDNISHHISEESLKWQDFGDKVIINNKSLDYLEMTWENFLNNYEKSNKLREKYIVDISLNGLQTNVDEAFTLLDSLLISPFYFSYEKPHIDKQTIKKIEMKEDGKIYLKCNDSYYIIANPFTIEDLKAIL